MELKELVVSLETANKLKKAGWNKPTVYVWSVDGRGVFPFPYVINGEYGYSAPTADELLQELPASIPPINMKKGDYYTLSIIKSGIRYGIGYKRKGKIINGDLRRYKSLSEAAASMWLWLEKEGYIK